MSIATMKNYQDSISTVLDTSYVPPMEEGQETGIWVFTQFIGGAELANDGSSSKVELFWDATGDGVGMELIDAVYTASETYSHTLNQSTQYVLDGTARFVVRRTVLGGNQTTLRQIYAQVQGFTY